MVKSRPNTMSEQTRRAQRGRGSRHGTRSKFSRLLQVIFPHTMDKTARNTRKTALMRAIKEAATGEVVATIDELTSGLRSLLVADSSTAQLAGALLTPDVCAGLVQGYAFEPCVRAVNHDVSRAAIAHEVNTTGRIPIKRFVDEACVRHHRINHIRVKREKMKPKYVGKDDMTIEDELAPSVEDVQTSIAVIKSSFEGSAQILRDATTSPPPPSGAA